MVNLAHVPPISTHRDRSADSARYSDDPLHLRVEDATMSPDNTPDSPPAKQSWQERERNLALLRMANAQANLAGLEEQAEGPGAALAAVDADDLVLVESIEDELVKLRVKATARFGGGAARDRIGDLEYKQRLVLDRVGFNTFEQYAAVRDTPAGAGVDADVLAFARREFQDAQQAFLDIANLDMPEREPDDDEFDLDGEDAEIINLNVKPAAS